MAEPSWPSPAGALLLQKAVPTLAGGFDLNDLQDDKTPEKLTMTFYGSKDGGKSTQSFGVVGPKFVIAHDHQSKAARDNFIHKGSPDIRVFDALKYYTEADPKTAIKTLDYTIWALDNITTAWQRPNWVILDAGNVMLEVAEAYMRAKHNLDPETAFSNLNFWKARKQYVRGVWRKAIEVAKMGCLFVTYNAEEVLARENGFPTLSKKAPKWIDLILQETSITVECISAYNQLTKSNVYKAVVSCKRDNPDSVLGQMFKPGGETFDVTNGLIPWKERLAKFIELANNGQLGTPVEQAEAVDDLTPTTIEAPVIKAVTGKKVVKFDV